MLIALVLKCKVTKLSQMYVHYRLQAGQNAQQAKQATSQAVSQAAPGKADAESPAEEFKEVVDSTKKTFFEVHPTMWLYHLSLAA